MKKFLYVIVSIILFLLINILAINLCISSIVVRTINDNMVKGSISDRVTDILYDYYPDVTMDNLEDIENYIEGSEEVYSICNEYFDSIMNYINSNDESVPDTSDEIKNLINNYRDKFRDYGISDNDIDKIINYAYNESNIESVYVSVRDNVAGNLTANQKEVVKVYNIFSSNNMMYGLIIGITICIIVLSVLKKSLYGFMMGSGIVSLISGIIIKFIIIGGINILSYNITNKILGRSCEIDTSMLSNVGIIYMIMGIIFVVLYIIFHKISSRNQE